MLPAKVTPETTYQIILHALEDLIKVVAKLRDPNTGCPWDLAQTPQTLIPYVIEEAYEVVDALKSEDTEAIVEELGDLLLQVVLQAQIASDLGDFSLKEVAENITAKLIRRHPHVFADTQVETPEEVRDNWEKIKASEKGETAEMTQLLSYQLKRYLRRLPTLMASHKIADKAANAGFEWQNIDGVWEKFYEEFAEFKEALTTQDKQHQQEELGDLLFTLTNIARWYDLDCSEALDGTNRRFIARLSKIESFADRPLCEYSLDELDTLWKQAKLELAKGENENNRKQN